MSTLNYRKKYTTDTDLTIGHTLFINGSYRKVKGMKKKFNQYTLQSWYKTFKGVCKQLIIPFAIFQGIRTILLPTAFDVLLLAIFILIAFAFQNEWI